MRSLLANLQLMIYTIPEWGALVLGVAATYWVINGYYGTTVVAFGLFVLASAVWIRRRQQVQRVRFGNGSLSVTHLEPHHAPKRETVQFCDIVCVDLVRSWVQSGDLFSGDWLESTWILVCRDGHRLTVDDDIAWTQWRLMRAFRMHLPGFNVALATEQSRSETDGVWRCFSCG